MQFRREENGLEVVERSFEGREVASARVPQNSRFRRHVTLLPVPQRWLNGFENTAATMSAQKSSELNQIVWAGRKIKIKIQINCLPLKSMRLKVVLILVVNFDW